MNVHFSEVVGEILCGNNDLDKDSSFEEFYNWCQDLAEDIFEGYDPTEDFPNATLYINDPNTYWPYVEKVLKG